MSRMSDVAAVNLSDLNLGGSGSESVASPAGSTEEAKTETTEKPKDAVQADSSEKKDAEPDKKDEPKESEIKKINNQIRALNRIHKAQELKMQELQNRESELSSLAKQLEVKEAEVRKYDAIKDMTDLDLLSWVAEQKKTPFKELLRKAIAHAATGEPEAEPEPEKEEELSPAMKKILDELTGLKTKLSEKEKQELEAQRLAEEEYEESLVQGFTASVLNLVNENDYPILESMDADEVEAEVVSISNRYAEKTGEAPEPKDILEYLEEKYTAKAQKLSERLQKKTGSDKSSSEAETVSTPAPQGVGTPATETKVEAPKAVSNAMAGDRGSGTEIPRRSDRERIAAAAAFLSSRSR